MNQKLLSVFVASILAFVLFSEKAYPQIMGTYGTNQSISTTTTSSQSMTTITLPVSSLQTIKIFDNVSSPMRTGDRVTVTLLGRPNGIATFDVSSRSAQAGLYPITTTSTLGNPTTTVTTNQTTMTNTNNTATTNTNTTVAVNNSYGTTSTMNTTNNTPNINTANLKTGIPMEEMSPGMYVGTYTVQDGDTFNNAMLTGHLALPTGENLIASIPTVNQPSFYAAYIEAPVLETREIPNLAALTETNQTTTQMTPVYQSPALSRPVTTKAIRNRHPLALGHHSMAYHHHRYSTRHRKHYRHRHVSYRHYNNRY